MRDLQAAFGDLVIDGPAWEVRLRGTAIDLTRTEFEILLVLASQPRRVVTDDEIVAAVWGEGWFGDENNLAVHVSKLRHKLGESGLRPRYIRTVRGVGYRFDPQQVLVPGPADALATREHVCEGMLSAVGSIEVRTDGQLRVVSVEPVDAPVLGHDPGDLLGRYAPWSTVTPGGTTRRHWRPWTSSSPAEFASGPRGTSRCVPMARPCMPTSPPASRSTGRVDSRSCASSSLSATRKGGGGFDEFRTPRPLAPSVRA